MYGGMFHAFEAANVVTRTLVPLVGNAMLLKASGKNTVSVLKPESDDPISKTILAIAHNIEIKKKSFQVPSNHK